MNFRHLVIFLVSLLIQQVIQTEPNLYTLTGIPASEMTIIKPAFKSEESYIVYLPNNMILIGAHIFENKQTLCTYGKRSAPSPVDPSYFNLLKTLYVQQTTKNISRNTNY